MRPTLTDLFRTRVSECSDLPAVINHAGREFTYRMLESQTTQIQAWLARQGICHNDKVALRLDLGPALVAAIQAVRRCGAIPVMLDGLTPMRRVRRMCTIANARHVIDHRVLYDAAADISAPAPEQPSVEDAVDPFQIFFTSGSTGDPKGVILPAEAVVNRLEWMWREYPFAPDEVMLAWKAPSLVASIWEILGGLLAGIPTVYADLSILLDDSSLTDFLLTFGITRISLTPPLLEKLVAAAAVNGRLKNQLRVVTCGADILPVSLARAAKRAFPDCTLLNLYGLTECASNVAAFDLVKLRDDDKHVPIGRAVGGASIRIVDKWNRVTPTGVTGELVVTGRAVGLGYLRQDLEADERFSIEQTDRSFTTGDLGRYRPDGEIELVGRLDNQLNFNGYRIAPEEIEGWLNRMAGVVSAIVLDESNDSLVALVESTEKIDKSVALALLRSVLPAYMVPSRIVSVPSLPRTRSGKIDRQELPLLLRTAWRHPTRDKLPTDRLSSPERHVYEAWCELLDDPPLTSDDDFFEHGGHSLLAIRLVGLLRERTGSDLSLRTIMEESTFAAIVAAVDGGEAHGETAMKIADATRDTDSVSSARSSDT